MLIWKGSQGTVSKTEDRLIEQVINEYYGAYFNGFDGFNAQQRSDLRQGLLIDDRNNPKYIGDDDEVREEAVSDKLLDDIEAKRRLLKVCGSELQLIL
jgi:hypothetical protein